MTRPPLPTVTPLQFAFLTVLSEKTLTGKQMRSELAQSGVQSNEAAFFRVIQRLKRTGLVSAERIARDEGEYRGAQCEYEITQAGRAAAALMRGLYRRADRRTQRLRWRRSRNHKLSRRFNQSAEQAGASRSERR